MRLSYLWLGILSELFINLAAGWFGVVFIVVNIDGKTTFENLIFKTFLGILSLLIAKQFRQGLADYEKLY
jgi:hypothetical protein